MKKILPSAFAILLPTNQSELFLIKVIEIFKYAPTLILEVAIAIIIFIIVSVILTNNIINCFINFNYMGNLFTFIIPSFCGLICCYFFFKLKFKWVQRKIRLLTPIIPIKSFKSIGSQLLKFFFIIFALTFLYRICFVSQPKKTIS